MVKITVSSRNSAFGTLENCMRNTKVIISLLNSTRVVRLLLAWSIQLMAYIGGININAYYIVIIYESQLWLNNCNNTAHTLATCVGFRLTLQRE